MIDRPRKAIYIDDCVDLGHDELELKKRQDEYTAVLDDIVGVSWEKSKPPSEEQSMLGLHLSSDKLLGVHPTKLWTLIKQTELVIHEGEATGLQLAHLVGKWTHAILVRRPVFSLLDAAYRFIRVAGARKFTLWSSVARELLALCDLAPLYLWLILLRISHQRQSLPMPPSPAWEWWR